MIQKYSNVTYSLRHELLENSDNSVKVILLVNLIHPKRSKFRTKYACHVKTKERIASQSKKRKDDFQMRLWWKAKLLWQWNEQWNNRLIFFIHSFLWHTLKMRQKVSRRNFHECNFVLYSKKTLLLHTASDPFWKLMKVR